MPSPGAPAAIAIIGFQHEGVFFLGHVVFKSTHLERFSDYFGHNERLVISTNWICLLCSAFPADCQEFL